MVPSNTWFPIEEIKGRTLSFIGWTANGKPMVFNNKAVDDWLINKYRLTYYMIPKPPTDEN